jgi:hypothetical protein
MHLHARARLDQTRARGSVLTRIDQHVLRTTLHVESASSVPAVLERET